MLARIAKELFWLGRYLARAEHTARMLDGIFHVNLQARAEDQPGLPPSWDALVTIMGLEEAASDQPARPDEVVLRLTLDPDAPASIRWCVTGARERARAVRDAISTDMWESVNTFYLELLNPDVRSVLESSPYLIYQRIKERCVLFWGLADETMLRDEAHAFLMAGGRLESADMVLRMLLMALPEDPSARSPDRAALHVDGPALALLHAVGGAQAYRRAAHAPATVLPVVRFLLFERHYPESVTASLDALRDLLADADHEGRECPSALRLERLSAELELRRRETGAAELAPTIELVQTELERIDRDTAARYFARAQEGRQPSLT